MHAEAWTKATVVLFDRQLIFLDRLCADIRSRTGSRFNRTQVIRALIDALALSGFDATTSGSESDLTRRLLRKLSV